MSTSQAMGLVYLYAVYQYLSAVGYSSTPAFFNNLSELEVINLQKMNTKKLVLLITLLFAFTSSYSQKKSTTKSKQTGNIYVTDTDSKIPFIYKVSYMIDSEGNYLSKYKILIYGEYKFDIIAKHIKAKKKIEVEVAGAGGGILSTISEQSTEYETPSLKLFGFQGAANMLGGKRVPYQLAVGFLSNKFTYVKVYEVLGYHGSDGAEFYSFK